MDAITEYFNLFFAFFKVGLFTFGGGYAMLPMLEREIVERYKYATQEELLDCIAIGQCTPGVIAVNTASLVGYHKKGVLGCLSATLGIVTPSFVIILLLSTVLQTFATMPIVAWAFAGIRIAACGLIVTAIITLWKTSVVDNLCLGITIVSFSLIAFLNVSPIFIVMGTLVLGFFYKGQVRKS